MDERDNPQEEQGKPRGIRMTLLLLAIIGLALILFELLLNWALPVR